MAPPAGGGRQPRAPSAADVLRALAASRDHRGLYQQRAGDPGPVHHPGGRRPLLRAGRAADLAGRSRGHARGGEQAPWGVHGAGRAVRRRGRDAGDGDRAHGAARRRAAGGDGTPR